MYNVTEYTPPLLKGRESTVRKHGSKTAANPEGKLKSSVSLCPRPNLSSDIQFLPAVFTAT